MKTSWIALALALLCIAAILLLETPREHFVSPGKMYGPAIRGNDPNGIPIVAVQNLPDGQKVYLAEEGGYVKMVAANGQNGYFKGTLSEFDPKKWDSYKNDSKGYKLDVNDLPEPPKPPPPAPAATPGSYAAACTNCETINGKVVCKCDVTPK